MTWFTKTKPVEFIGLCALSFGALLLHGYHPGAEDAEIYLPGVLKLLHPALFPYGSQFFQSHAGMTLYPGLIAASIRLTHMQEGVAILAWHAFAILLTLAACFRIARMCFRETYAVWCGTGMIASLLTLPIAGTALYIMDPYLTARSLSTPAALFAVGCVLAGSYRSAALWILVVAAIHPLMSIFVVGWAAIFAVLRYRRRIAAAAPAMAALALFPAVTPLYREILKSRPYFLLTNWAWYEWLGIFAPLLLLAWFVKLAREHELGPLDLACQASVALTVICLGLEIVIGVPGRFENLSELQLMRCLHLVYILMFLFGGALLGKFVLRSHAIRWLALFLPVCATMFLVQRQLFPASDHVEWPGARGRNPWVQAFRWVRGNTPQDAYFALDPHYTSLPQADEQGFRAVARRSMMADANKDAGAVSMFPLLAEQWERQVTARRGWRTFALSDFERLKDNYQVGWVIVTQPGVSGLACPYHNSTVLVCRIP
jgi:hypothetical protein